MKRRSLLLACLALLPAAPAAPASCSPGILSGGHFLKAMPAGYATLPPGDGEVDAAWPACNHGDDRELDRPTTATRLRGVPTDVAVRKGRTLYVRPGTLFLVRGHPLRDAMRLRVPRRRGRCRRERLRGPAYSASGSGVVIRNRWHVIADRRTRIANRKPHHPVDDRQRLDIRVSRCGRHRFADTITFVGRDREPSRVEPDFGGPLRRSIPYLIPLALVLAAAAIVRDAVRRA